MAQNMYKKIYKYINFLNFGITPIKFGFLGDAAPFLSVLCGGMQSASTICPSPTAPHVKRQVLLSCFRTMHCNTNMFLQRTNS